MSVIVAKIVGFGRIVLNFMSAFYRFARQYSPVLILAFFRYGCLLNERLVFLKFL
jgi:hypothetical protein